MGELPLPEMADFKVYWEAGRALLDGRPVYVDTGMPFVYPPFAALLAVPFALLPWDVARLAWLIGVVLPTVALTVRYAFATRWWPVLTVAAFTLGPVRDLVHFGQVGTVLMALCVVGCLRSGRWSASLVGVAAGVKLVPGLFIAYLGLRGRWRAACVAAATALATAVLGAVALPGGSWTYWTEQMFDMRMRSPEGYSNVSLLGLILKSPLPHTATWVLGAAALGALGVWSIRRSAPLTAVAVTGLLSVLLSPVGWPHYLVWVIVAVGALYRDGRKAAAVAVWVAFLPWGQTPVVDSVLAILVFVVLSLGPGSSLAETRTRTRSPRAFAVTPS